VWILPNNYQLSSAFVQDMVASREDLTLLASSIESSLMWRSKPSLLRTWSQRWNRVPWFQRLSSRILKPSQHISFETALTSLLEDTRASRFRQQESDLAPKTQDTYGPTSDNTSEQLDLLDASLKTSKDTSALDSEKSLAIWKAQVTTQRGEYSARLKSARLTRESESISWPTPSARDYKDTPGMATIAKNPDGTERKRLDQLARAAYQAESATSGHLNPDWVEWLMGVPTGWTGLGSWETE